MYLGIAYDSLRLLGYVWKDFYIDIKPTGGYRKLISGPAFTTFGEVISITSEEYLKVDNIRLELYNETLFTNSPIVVLQANDNVVAHSGDITSLIYKKLGAIGFITDGNV